MVSGPTPLGAHNCRGNTGPLVRRVRGGQVQRRQPDAAIDKEFMNAREVRERREVQLRQGGTVAKEPDGHAREVREGGQVQRCDPGVLRQEPVSHAGQLGIARRDATGVGNHGAIHLCVVCFWG